MKRSMAALVLAATAVLASGCAHHAYPGPDAWPADGAAAGEPVYPPSRGEQADAPVRYGVVRAIEPVNLRQGGASGAGAAIGAVAGALIGREFGFSSDGQANGVVFGTLAGAMLGDRIERDQQGARQAVRVSVQLDRGGARAFDFRSAGDLRVGDRVRIEGRQLYRM